MQFTRPVPTLIEPFYNPLQCNYSRTHFRPDPYKATKKGSNKDSTWGPELLKPH